MTDRCGCPTPVAAEIIRVYKLYFKTAGSCPMEPPKTDTVMTKLHKARVVNSSDFNPVSNKPTSIKSVEVTLPLYRARTR